MRLNYYLLLSFLFLASCSSSSASSHIYEEHNYDEVKNLFITYDQSFTISENEHYIYFFQETCHNCEEIKNEVIDFALNKHGEIFFVIATTGIPSNYSFEDINSTIGSSDIADIFVGVTPQLTLIKNGTIEKNIIKNIYIEEELSHRQ